MIKIHKAYRNGQGRYTLKNSLPFVFWETGKLAPTREELVDKPCLCR